MILPESCIDNLVLYSKRKYCDTINSDIFKRISSLQIII